MDQLSRELAVRDAISRQQRSATEDKAAIVQGLEKSTLQTNCDKYLLHGSQVWRQIPMMQEFLPLSLLQES